MADQSDSYAPQLPPMKIYVVHNGNYKYLYPCHTKVKSNGRVQLVKGPKSAGRLHPTDSANKYRVVWQDWFLEKMPELRSYNTYYDSVSSSEFSNAPQPCFTFTAKSGTEHTNSMNCQQYYEAGATWVLDQLLANSPLLSAINKKYLKDQLSPEMIALTYYIALTENTNFANYSKFAGHTRLATQEPFTATAISKTLKTLSTSSTIDFWEDLYQRTSREFSLNTDFWVIDTDYPNHILERLGQGEAVPYIENSKDTTLLIARYKRKALFKDANAEHNFQRILQQQATRIMSVINVKNGQAFSHTLYNGAQVNSSDIVTFLQSCPMWRTQSSFEDDASPIEREDAQYLRGVNEHLPLTDEQLSPKLRAVTSPLLVGASSMPSLQPLYPSNLNVARTTVVINNNLDTKDSRDKVISRPVSGIVTPLRVQERASSEDSVTPQSGLTKEQARELASLRFSSQKRFQSTEKSTYEELYTQLRMIEEIKGNGTQQPTPLNQRITRGESVNNEQVTAIDVTRMQALYGEQEQQALQAQEAQEAQEALERAKGKGRGILVTDRSNHITEQFRTYQQQNLPFFLQVLPESALYQLCIDGIGEFLAQPSSYSPLLNRSCVSVNLLAKPEDYAEILQTLYNGESSDKEVESEAVASIKPKRTSSFGSIFDDEADTFSERRQMGKYGKRARRPGELEKIRGQLKTLFQGEDINNLSPLTLHVCLDFRELFKLLHSLDAFSEIEGADNFVDQAEIDEAVHNRSNDYKVKQNIVARASGRMGHKPRYTLTSEQQSLADTIDDLLQRRNHVMAPEIARMHREHMANKTLDQNEAKLLRTPPHISNWSVERENRLQESIRDLLLTKLPRSILKISITNSMHQMSDALFACNMLQTQQQMYERLAGDILQQERDADNVLLNRLCNNQRELECQGKQFLWFLALNMKFMLNVRMESCNRANQNMLAMRKDILTTDELVEQLRMITASRKESGLEYPRHLNSKQQLMLLSYLGLQEPSSESFTNYKSNNIVPLMADSAN